MLAFGATPYRHERFLHYMLQSSSVKTDIVAITLGSGSWGARTVVVLRQCIKIRRGDSYFQAPKLGSGLELQSVRTQTSQDGVID